MRNKFKLVERKRMSNTPNPFKAGDVVVCVDTGGNQYLTKGKHYTVLNIPFTDIDKVNIKDDNPFSYTNANYYHHRFELVERKQPVSNPITLLDKLIAHTHNICVETGTLTKLLEPYAAQFEALGCKRLAECGISDKVKMAKTLINILSTKDNNASNNGQT